MNSLEVQKLGMKYCNNHYDKCEKDCPLRNQMCIDNLGEINVMPKDFVEFAKEFNFMLKEIGAIETPEKPKYITYKDVMEYCKKQGMVVIAREYFEQMQDEINKGNRKE